MNKIQAFNECVFICDQSSWVWNTTSHFLDIHKIPYIHLSSDVSVRKSWSRIGESPKILIHWESRFRHGGAIVEELLAVSPKFELEDRLIVICSDPSPEDRVYLEELKIHNVVTLRNNQFDIRNSYQDLKAYFFRDPSSSCKHQKVWRKLFLSLKALNQKTSDDHIRKVEGYLHRVGSLDQHSSERYFHALGLYHYRLGRSLDASRHWQKALDINPNYSPSREAMVELYCDEGKYQKALGMLKQMQARNKNNVARLVRMGEIHLSMNDNVKAEHYFCSALNKDRYCGGALNGLATIRFEQGKLDESRQLLAQSSIAYQIASKLNEKGIKMVREAQYEKALEHYTKAHYVLPQQDKGPMLFYNIGLCYSRWGRAKPAQQFLQLALIKEPNYKKAQKLLNQLRDPAEAA
ncbi:tetratricopeptide repeat protein [Pseudobacteriovorax antillogorgiicola]|uniref:Pentatricopeptide repeat domain-containing protein (PPR motif) n=1 Tax=Pseudobacteriovorax antillogorgiicola TaxID=1513793 RepID=A0A1Y6BRE9_9BACT|nr:tetratricopeptide repeat protein [Pseudobacteriovorax antillogorgiicola]TCS53840.1 pentatricopeptide repeat protein [Pseudobacteriovorax antillogorgiicola]SMF21675.1 pentatricopeptide repeat domain-containing protein (PPR motif) [Pseudobacteriovorax antillogorgiicola]